MKIIPPLIIGLMLAGCATVPQPAPVHKAHVIVKAPVKVVKPSIPLAPPVLQPPVKKHWWQKLQKFHLNLP